MNDHDGGQAVVMAKLLHNLQHLILVVNVQTAGWFIQQQQLRLLGQRSCQHDLLPFAAGELI